MRDGYRAPKIGSSFKLWPGLENIAALKVSQNYALNFFPNYANATKADTYRCRAEARPQQEKNIPEFSTLLSFSTQSSTDQIKRLSTDRKDR